jgi:menaquinone-dependent protoporphyrinogen IX oxidase
MKSVVVYESMYGNTHAVADAIAAGLGGPDNNLTVLPVHEATTEALAGVDLLVVGGPTHVHGMTRPSTRKAAVDAAEKPDANLVLDPDAEGEGLREWFDEAGALPHAAAAFDTRADASAIVTGRASKGIAKRLHKHGCALVLEPESFLVTKENHLLDHETEHARAWGAALGAAIGAGAHKVS